MPYVLQCRTQLLDETTDSRCECIAPAGGMLKYMLAKIIPEYAWDSESQTLL